MKEFSLKQLTIEGQMKDREMRLVNMLILALLAMDGYTNHEVVYFTKTKLTDELIALYPIVTERLRREPRKATP